MTFSLPDSQKRKVESDLVVLHNVIAEIASDACCSNGQCQVGKICSERRIFLDERHIVEKSSKKLLEQQNRKEHLNGRAVTGPVKKQDPSMGLKKSAQKIWKKMSSSKQSPTHSIHSEMSSNKKQKGPF